MHTTIHRPDAYWSGLPVPAAPNPTPGHTLISIWGQSNAVGRADQSDISASPLSTSDPGLATLAAGPFSRVFIWSGSAFVQLNLAANNNGSAAGQFGPEFGLAVRWMRETTSGNLYLTKEASSGVSITYFDPTNWIYGGMVTRQNNAAAWLATNGVTLVNRYWLWVQGESDAAQTQSWYQTRLEDLIAARIADGIHAADTPTVLVQMRVGSANYGAGVVAAKTAVAAAAPATVFTTTMSPYFKVDNLHPNGRGQLQLAYDAAEKYFGWPHLNA